MASRNLYRIIVQELPWTASAADLKQYFSQFGPIVRATVIFDEKLGLSKRHGYVDFAMKEAKESALFKNRHEMENKSFRVLAFDAQRS